ncbi:MAG: fibronectin type III domain-containing protein [Phormidesmis sp.]
MNRLNSTRSKPYKAIILLLTLAITTLSIIVMQSANLPTPADPSPAAQSSPFAQTGTLTQTSDTPTLLTDPFLQLPTPSTVNVVWFTEFEGTEHTVEYGDSLTAADTEALTSPNTVSATTTQLSRTREDSDSQVQGRAYPEVTKRNIWRHEATVTGLKPGDRTPYRVISKHATGQLITSDSFTLSAATNPDQPQTILLASDHQLKPLTPANLQKADEVAAQAGGKIDAVFFAGDLITIPDRASEWFDNAKGLALFPGLQGRTNFELEKAGTTIRYTGGQIIQHAPLFPIIGIHEVMGRYADTDSLKSQYASPLPRNLVEKFYTPPETTSPTPAWVADHSYNTQTYEEIFSLPSATLSDGSQTSTYYATTFGDIRLISLYGTQIWRSPSLSPDTRGRYREKADALNKPETWGYGQHIFEEIRKGSEQYNWLQQELASDEFKAAKYKIVMLHHPPHTLGGNISPPFTDPVMVENRSANGALQSVQYEYPPEEDYIVRDLIPLLEAANVQLVFYGHSHLWNRFTSSSGMHFLETSNVGNSYGAHTEGNPRPIPTAESVAEAGDLAPFRTATVSRAVGDPNGLLPVIPTIAPLTDDSGQPLPYIASNDITSFTLFDTGTGTLSSYYFDTREPNSDVIKFDEFTLSDN